MKPLVPPNGKCPHSETRTECPLVCKYNHFESEELTIDAWELKCLDCGWRDTVGFRSDEMDEEEMDEDEVAAESDPTQCPFCSRKGLSPGQRPCEQGF